MDSGGIRLQSRRSPGTLEPIVDRIKERARPWAREPSHAKEIKMRGRCGFRGTGLVGGDRGRGRGKIVVEP